MNIFFFEQLTEIEEGTSPKQQPGFKRETKSRTRHLSHTRISIGLYAEDLIDLIQTNILLIKIKQNSTTLSNRRHYHTMLFYRTTLHLFYLFWLRNPQHNFNNSINIQLMLTTFIQLNLNPPTTTDHSTLYKQTSSVSFFSMMEKLDNYYY